VTLGAPRFNGRFTFSPSLDVVGSRKRSFGKIVRRGACYGEL